MQNANRESKVQIAKWEVKKEKFKKTKNEIL